MFARAIAIAAALSLSVFAVAIRAAAQGGAAPPAAPAAAPAPSPGYDAALAAKVGADERGMRQYVLVILKTGPTKVPAGPERDAMFKGHFSNMTRLADAGKLAVAGPFGANDDGWRGLFVFAVADVEEARRLVATDPVIQKGEMIAEFHPWYGSAAMMLVPDAHKKIAKNAM
jgi:uncharacterized protein YciI